MFFLSCKTKIKAQRKPLDSYNNNNNIYCFKYTTNFLSPTFPLKELKVNKPK